MLLPHGTVIALIDGANFELYRNAGDEREPQLAPLDSPKLDAGNHSAAGRQSSPGNPGGHQGSEDAHAIAAVNWLNSQVLGHRIESLIVFAPPRTLGEMRRHYHKQTEKIILKEYAKDMVGRQPTDIVTALREQH